jgi:hypothetical protein
MEVLSTEPGAAVVKLSRNEVSFLTIFCSHTARGLYETVDRRMAEGLEAELTGVLEAIDDGG